MRLSDLMASFDLAVYPQVAMVIFLVVFVGVLRRAVFGRWRADRSDPALLPLADDAPVTTRSHTR